MNDKKNIVRSQINIDNITIDREKSVPERFNLLSKREKQIAFLLLKDNRQKEIAEYLEISPKTVSTYNSRLFLKLGVNTSVGFGIIMSSNNITEFSDAKITEDKIKQKELKKVKNALDIV